MKILEGWHTRFKQEKYLALLSWGSSDHMQDKINSQQHLEKWDESRKPSLRWITYLIKP